MHNSISKLSITFKSKIALITATVIWGIAFSVMKSSIDEISPNLVLALRFTGAALLLSIIFFKKFKKTNLRYVYEGALLGLFLFAAYEVQTLGLVTTTPGKNAFLTAVYCVIVPFLYWILKRKRPDAFHFIAAFICIIGIGLVSLKSDLTMGIGDLLTLASGFMYAVHMIAVAEFTKDKDSVLLTIFQFLFSAIFSWIAHLLLEIPPETFSNDAIWQIVFLALLATAVALLLQNVGQKHLDPQTASLFLSLESVFGVLFSIILGYEDITLQIALGFVVIFVAIIISETKLSFILKKKN